MTVPQEFLSGPLASKGGVFALGNFDGVHRGHQEVIKAAIGKAREMNVPARVLTFEPHPRSVFSPDRTPFRLTPAPVKENLLLRFGIQKVEVQPFTLGFSHLSAMEFIENILLKHYGMQHAVAGFDFVFGHGRQGNMENLRAWLAPHNIEVTEVTPHRKTDGEVFSSSRARQALQDGDLKTAEYILGRRWSVAGIVMSGAKRGRTIGVPTANIPLGDYLRPKFGVYAVKAGPTGFAKTHSGVANIGVRPTVGGTAENLEVHLFDFDSDIYGQEWEVELVDFIRPERAFDGLEALRRQINMDIEAAKTRLRL